MANTNSYTCTGFREAIGYRVVEVSYQTTYFGESSLELGFVRLFFEGPYQEYGIIIRQISYVLIILHVFILYKILINSKLHYLFQIIFFKAQR